MNRPLRWITLSALTAMASMLLTGPAAATPPGIPSKATAQSRLNALTVATQGSMTGYSRDELLKMSVQDLTPEMRQDAAGLLWNRFIQAGTQAGDYVLVRKNGSPVAVHYAAYASVAPGVHVSLLTPTDLASGISSAI